MPESITSLADLAAKANENHQLAEQTAGSALEYARIAGVALIEAKAQLNTHGAWLPWLRENFKGSQRTAYRYAQLASNLPCVASLEPKSINEALRMIAGEDEDEEPEEDIPDSFHEALADVQHGRVSPAEELPEEPRAVAVEVVENDGYSEDRESEEYEQPEPEAGVALVYARTAIDALNKIPKRDPSRKAALKMISDWLDKQ